MPLLTVATEGLGHVLLGPPGGVYGLGQRVALVADPIAGWRFDRWEGALSGSQNPDTVTVGVGIVVQAVFEKLPRHAIALTTIGSGNVMLSPPGGTVPEGARVTLTAQPAPGWRFESWGGSIGGSSNPHVLTVHAPRSVTAEFVPESAGRRAFEDVLTGTSSGADTVATAGPAAPAGELHLATISTRPRRSVISVSGLGLAWMRVAEQCAGRNQTGVEVWRAYGPPAGGGPVTATLSAVADHAVIAVAGYSDVDPLTPIGAVVSANSSGVAGPCAGGVDGASYSFDVVADSGSVVFGAIAHRHRLHTEGPGFTERVEIHEGSGGSGASVSVVDRQVDAAGSVVVSGAFDGAVDWAAVAVEVRAGTGAAEPSLHLFATGLGSVAVDPPVELQGEGTVVTLTATPHDGWEFESWSGALGGSHNPDSLVLSGQVGVGALFRRSDLVALRRGTIGAGNVDLDPPARRHAPGAHVTATATAHPDWTFERWAGAATGAVNPTTFIVGPDDDVVAIFRHVGATTSGLWTSPEELVARPISGPAWERLLAGADASFDPPDLGRDSADNIECLAAAIVWARTGDDSYRRRVVAACSTLAAAGQPAGETLDWAREVGAYALAADLVEYRTPELESWLANVAETWVAADARTLLAMFLERPNNWGAHAFGTLASIQGYLGDVARLTSIRAAWVRGVEGPDPGYEWGERSWHADLADPRLINPRGSARDGLELDGAMPDDLRRGGPFSIPPPRTGYPWETLQGVLMAARVLERCDPNLGVWHVGDDAIRRAANLLQVAWEGEFGEWAARGDDVWLLPFLDDAYGTAWATGNPHEWGAGKNAGWAYVLLPPSNATEAPIRGATPIGTRLERTFPNPFATATEIRYTVAHAGRVELVVHDVAGRLVTTLVDALRTPGTHAVRWPGVDARGRPVASGVYWIRLRTERHEDTSRVTLRR